MKKGLLGLLIAGILIFGMMSVEILAVEMTNHEFSQEQLDELSTYPFMSGIATFAETEQELEETEPNDEMSQADIAKSGYYISGTLSGGDKDYYKLTLSSRSEIKCAIASLTESFIMKIYDEDNNYLASSGFMYEEDGAYAHGLIATLDAGTYYMVASTRTSVFWNLYMYYFQVTHVHGWALESYNMEAETIKYKCRECGETKTEKMYIDKDAIVYRICGATRYDTAFKTADKLKESLGIERFENVIVATGKNFADALSGSYLAYVKEAPILLTNENNIEKVKAYIQKNVKVGGTVYVLGGERAVSLELEDAFYGTGEYEVERISGQNRYETNLKILKEAGVSDEEIIVCTGHNYADSLSASALKKPILLVTDYLHYVHSYFLEEHFPNKIYIIGGDGAVSEKIENDLSDYGTVERIYGSTRFETSAKIAKYFFPNADDVVLAYGKNFPDGLCGGPLACSLNAPLILATTGKTTAAKGYTEIDSIDKGYVLGGSGLISDGAARKIFNKSSNNTIIMY